MPSTNRTSVLSQLVCHEIDRFGPLAPQSLLLVLAGISGFTVTPVCIRTVGVGEFHTEFGLHLVELLGPNRVEYLTAVSGSGLVALGGHGQIRVIVHDGQPLEIPTADVFYRLIRRKPVRTLDAPLGKKSRVRQFDRPVCIILLDNGAIDDPVVRTHLITTKIEDSAATLRYSLDRRFAYLARASNKDLWRRKLQCAKIAKTLKQVSRNILLQAPDISAEIRQRIGDVGDIERLRQVYVLAGIVEFLSTYSRDTTLPRAVCISPDAVEFVIDLLELAGVVDERAPLTFAQEQTLQELRTSFMPPASSPVRPSKPLLELERPTMNATHTTGVFTVKELRLKTSHASINISTIHSRLCKLEDYGSVERIPEKRGKQCQWKLTQRGMNAGQVYLVTLLRRLYPLSTPGNSKLSPLMEALKKSRSPVGQLRQHRPTSAPGVPTIKSPPAATASPKNGNFGAKQESHADGCVGRRNGV